jgi:hypothetical protein
VLAPGAGAEHGIRHGVVGIGPGRGDKAARMLHRFATVPDGAFVWTRDCGGGYHLGRISGPMSEDRSRAARAVGIVYVAPDRLAPARVCKVRGPARRGRDLCARRP